MHNIINQFINHDISTPYFKLTGTNTYARLVDIHDGDTIKVVIPLFNNFYKFNVRLNGIDTCELKSHNMENKNKAIQARNKICELINEKWKNKKEFKLDTQKEIKEYLNSFVCLVYIKCYDFDKYGRLLADVYINYDNPIIHLSDILLNENLAYKYDGGTKLSEKDQLTNLNE